jgi:hypothetical protein
MMIDRLQQDRASRALKMFITGPKVDRGDADEIERTLRKMIGDRAVAAVRVLAPRRDANGVRRGQVVLTLSNTQARADLFRRRAKLRDDGVFVSDSLTPRQRQYKEFITKHYLPTIQLSAGESVFFQGTDARVYMGKDPRGRTQSRALDIPAPVLAKAFAAVGHLNA